MKERWSLAKHQAGWKAERPLQNGRPHQEKLEGRVCPSSSAFHQLCVLGMYLLFSEPQFPLLQNGERPISSRGNIRGLDKTFLRVSSSQSVVASDLRLPGKMLVTSAMAPVAPGSEAGAV